MKRYAHSIPLKTVENGWELSELCSIFVLAKGGQCQLIHELMGLIATSFLGTHCNLACAQAAAHSPSHLGASQVRRALAFEQTNYFVIYSGFKTLPGLPSARPATLPNRGQGGVENPQYCQRVIFMVSNFDF